MCMPTRVKGPDALTPLGPFQADIWFEAFDNVPTIGQGTEMQGKRCPWRGAFGAMETSYLRQASDEEESEMSVAQIIATKGREVLAIQPHRTLKEVAEILSARNIGAVAVADIHGTLLGMLSEREIVQAIARCGAKVLDDVASKHMNMRVVTTTEDETVLAVTEKINAGRFRHIPVVKEGRLAGIVSIGDVVKFRLDKLVDEHSVLYEYIGKGQMPAAATAA
jgi:CBS domain-containing protein